MFMEKRTKKPLVFLLSLLLIVLIMGLMAGCTDDDGDPINDDDKLFGLDSELVFVNGEYAASGDEALPHYLTELRTIEFDGMGNYWMHLLNALKEPGDEGMETAISESVVFKEIYLDESDDEILVVDLESIGGGGGSLQESFFINQIVETVMKNKDRVEDCVNVNKVQFMLGGEKVESLMGHFDASKPFESQMND